MNIQRTKRKKTGISAWIILGILLAAIVFGVLFDLVATQIERQTYPKKYAEFVEKYSDEYGVPETIIYAVIKAESNFDRTAVSSAEPPALGLMQLQEETYEWVASYLLKETPSAFDIYDPETNIRNGTRYLAYLYGRFGNWDTVFAAYNAGPGNVSKWLEDSEYSDDGETLKYIPFKETRGYVEKVNRFRETYERLYYAN